MFRTAAAFLLIAVFTAIRAGADAVHVFAAASLTEAVTDIARDYERATGVRVVLNFAGSSTLARQIEEGAPADLFLSADEQTMDRLQRRRLIDPASRTSILSNTLVVVVRRDSPARVRDARDLAGPRFGSIALAEPASVPAGIYARRYLEKLGVWQTVARKMIPTENVRGALAAVESGDADAAIVYRTDALISKKVRVALSVPRAEGPPISYPFAIVADSRQRAAARRFLTYLSSPVARKTFARYGFEWR